MSTASASTGNEGLLILWGSTDPAVVDQGALNDWWTNEHLPERLRLPGFQRARRYRALQPQHGHHEYLAWYQASSVRHLASPEYLHALNHPTPRTAHFMPTLAKMTRFACECASSRSLSVPTPDEPAEARDMLFMVVYQVAAAGLEHDLFQAIGKHVDLVRHGTSVSITHAHLAKVDEQVTRIGSASKSYDGVYFKSSQGRGETEPTAADIFVALYELRDSTTSNSTAESDIISNRLSDIRNIPGLRVEHTNTYELIASLDTFPLSH